MLDIVTSEFIRVRYGETDQMGHAYYGNYLLWYEQARGAWFRDRGLLYKDLEAEGCKLPVVEVWSRYSGEVKYDDDIEIQVRLTEIKRAAIKFEYDVINKTTGQECTSGYTWHVLVGKEMKAISFPDDLKAKFERNPAEHERLD